MLKITTHSPEETLEAAKHFAKLIKDGGVVALTGELGTGKTVFVKGVAQGLGIREQITSPTFVLVKPYDFNQKRLYHFDLYRLEGEKQLQELGFAETLADPQHVSLIEWAERAKNYLPKSRIDISFQHGAQKNERVIKLQHV